jgi:capsular exopolysaccharide synthesis family protein
MENARAQRHLSLEEVLRVLRRRWLLIIACFLLATGAALAYSLSQEKEYTATAALVFNNTQLSQQVAGLQATGGGDPAIQQGTNVELVQLGTTAAKTAQLVGHNLTADDIRQNLIVTSDAKSNIVRVSATSTTPALAAQIANAYTREFVKEQQMASGQYFSSALALVEKQLAALSPTQQSSSAGLALQDRAQSLKILTQIGDGNVRVAQAAEVPTAPSAPQVFRTTLLAAIIGAILGLAAAFLLERLDRRIKEPEELERIFKLPLLAAVPESPAYPRQASREPGSRPTLPVREAEVFRMLRAHLRYFNINRDLRIVLVTSASPGDGKTTVVQNLAEAAASVGSRVLIIEADLRRPTLAERMQLNRAPGLAEVLISAVSIEDAIKETAPVTTSLHANGGSSAVGRGVSLLPAGALPPNPVELLESDAMKGVLEWAARHYDLVMVDSAPLPVVPDAISVLRHVDGVVVVSRLGKTTHDEAARLHEQLTSLGAPVLGVVANRFQQAGSSSYGYGSYAGYAPEVTTREEEPVAR